MPKPGWFAPKGEKELYEAIKNQSLPDTIARIGDEHNEYRTLAYSVAGLLMLGGDDLQEVIRLLSFAFVAGDDPAEHTFTRKYFQTLVEIHITTGVTIHLPVNREAVGLALAEAYQHTGEVEKAVDVVEQLEPTAYAAVSLADLYTEAKRYEDVVELTDGVRNQDEATMVLLILRGIAFREQGLCDAAHETFKEALRSRSRSAELRHLALLERSQNTSHRARRHRPGRTSSASSLRTRNTRVCGSGSPSSMPNRHAERPIERGARWR